eukprot:363169-Chlamydomonas_euryale.AAC.16
MLPRRLVLWTTNDGSADVNADVDLKSNPGETEKAASPIRAVSAPAPKPSVHTLHEFYPSRIFIQPPFHARVSFSAAHSSL